ncbi:MAG: hypothetical protein MZV63_68285 [Marinilabiliales bacterium]|nr:hypothetical protein [Marinilabiliales bacterium]
MNARVIEPGWFTVAVGGKAAGFMADVDRSSTRATVHYVSVQTDRQRK